MLAFQARKDALLFLNLHVSAVWSARQPFLFEKQQVAGRGRRTTRRERSILPHAFLACVRAKGDAV